VISRTGPRLAAEFLGTAFLLAAVVGSGVMAERLTGDVALALLANALATGAILIVLIETLAPISGAHFNPAVTLAFALTRDIGPRLGAAYVAVQIAGGLAGVAVAHAMFDADIVQWSATVRTGPAQWLSEAVAAFGLVFFILMGARQRPATVPWLVGLYITAAYWFTASTSFANPAVTIARSFTDTFSGIRPGDAPVFIVMQFVGAVIAVPAAAYLIGRRHRAADAQ